jgi:hypothetical protein
VAIMLVLKKQRGDDRSARLTLAWIVFTAGKSDE